MACKTFNIRYIDHICLNYGLFKCKYPDILPPIELLFRAISFFIQRRLIVRISDF